MGTRNTLDPGTERVYAAAEKWVECALRNDDSLFTPGIPIWSTRWLKELHARFLDRPDRSSRTFMAKLEDQLRDSPPEVYQLMGEALYFHYLIVHTRNSSGELGHINSVLGWSSDPVVIPPDLVNGLTPGIATPGQGFHGYRPFQVGYIVEFLEQWKEQGPDTRNRLLNDPWAFKDFLTSIRLRSTLLNGRENTPLIQQQSILHLVFPDTFEAIVSTGHKERIADAFSDLVIEQTDDVDQKLGQIRQALESRFKSTGNHLFYHIDDVRQRWNPEQPVDPWNKLVVEAKAFIASGRLEEEEIGYKVKMGRELAAARDAVLEGSVDWPKWLKRALRSRPGHPMNFRTIADFNDWCADHSGEALEALRDLWTQYDVPVEHRVGMFCDKFPRTAIKGGIGTRLNIVSVLLMALDVYSYPPVRIRLFDGAYERTGYNRPEGKYGYVDEATLYEHALGFLDRFVEEATRRGVKLRHRLDAQSVLWMLPNDDDFEETDDDDDSEGDWYREDVVEPDLAALARDNYLTEGFLEEIVELLKDKKQIVFQGPPGTGKTYVAQGLAECLAGSKERVTLVQFHPSYAYEDFVQGFRPESHDGQLRFELKDGPLLRAAKEAEADGGRKHFLVIDEINRGNLAKVFGELYFLLEYRDREMTLQYSDSPFTLPENLYIIGTMNTADRSIALVDLALRRRFHFVEFHPDDEPVKGVLRRYLGIKAPDMEWVADVVERANVQLRKDRDAAIGPSYFMKDNLNEDSVQRIWKHNVLPYIKELLYDRDEDLKRFDLNSLRRGAASGGDGESEAPTDPQSEE